MIGRRLGTLIGCCAEPYSASPDGSKTILHEFNVFGEVHVTLVANDSGKKLGLFDLMFHDCNERVRKFEWSPDGTFVAWLIVDSNRYLPYGSRLLVFKITPNIDEVRQVVDLRSGLVDFEIRNDRLRYRDQAGKMTRMRLRAAKSH